MARIITKKFNNIRPSPRKCDIRKAKSDANAFVYGMRRVLSHFDDNSGGASTNDLATEIERLADELETVEDPLQIANLMDDIDDVISKLEI